MTDEQHMQKARDLVATWSARRGIDGWTEAEADIASALSEAYRSGVEAEREANGDALESIRSWCDAYPLQIFPEPDLRRARELLEAGGMTLDAISASSMRHVLKGIKEIIDARKA
jgi:hypothetical protein